MWGLGRRKGETNKPQEQDAAAAAPVPRLKDAIRQVRIETAERSNVVVDLRDAEVARLELVNDGLDPVFADIPPEIELFDRGISKGEVPRLWIDVIAYVVMARDKRTYRFLQDTRFGRKVLLETAHVPDMVEAVTRYVAGRLVERERALASDSSAALRVRAPRHRGHGIGAFLFGMIVGAAALFAVAIALAPY
jgi:hypothetical protein